MSRKATTFPLWSATDNCWNGKVDSLGLPVINVARLPIIIIIIIIIPFIITKTPTDTVQEGEIEFGMFPQ